MKLPFQRVWSSLVNVLLLLHQELPPEILIEMSWYVCKSLESKDLMKIDLTLVRGGVANSSKLMKRAQLKLLTS